MRGNIEFRPHKEKYKNLPFEGINRILLRKLNKPPRCGRNMKIWKYADSPKLFVQFMKEEMTATATAEGQLLKTYVLSTHWQCVYALSMSLLHVDDDDCDENDCTLVMVYIFSKCLKVLFYRAPPCYIYSKKTSKVNHEIGPTLNWFTRRESKLIRRVFFLKR